MINLLFLRPLIQGEKAPAGRCIAALPADSHCARPQEASATVSAVVNYADIISGASRRNTNPCARRGFFFPGMRGMLFPPTAGSPPTLRPQHTRMKVTPEKMQKVALTLGVLFIQIFVQKSHPSLFSDRALFNVNRETSICSPDQSLGRGEDLLEETSFK